MKLLESAQDHGCYPRINNHRGIHARQNLLGPLSDLFQGTLQHLPDLRRDFVFILIGWGKLVEQVPSSSVRGSDTD